MFPYRPAPQNPGFVHAPACHRGPKETQSRQLSLHSPQQTPQRAERSSQRSAGGRILRTGYGTHLLLLAHHRHCSTGEHSVTVRYQAAATILFCSRFISPGNATEIPTPANKDAGSASPGSTHPTMPSNHVPQCHSSGSPPGTVTTTTSLSSHTSAAHSPPCKVGWLQTELPGRVSSEVCLKPKLPAFKAMQRRRSAGEHAAHSCHPGSLSYPHTPVLGLHTSGTPRGKLTVSSDNSSGKRPLEGPYPDLLHARQPAELS